jgi:hypothetical protein
MSPEEIFSLVKFFERLPTLRNNGYIAMASATVVYYDYILTIPDEGQ